MFTDSMLGSELPMVTAVEMGVPVAVPSSGVTVHTTSSPPTKPPASVVPVPTGLPPMVQEMVDASGSPSASVKPV